MLGDKQWEYNDWLAAACGPDVTPLPLWRPKMYKVAGGPLSLLLRALHDRPLNDQPPQQDAQLLGCVSQGNCVSKAAVEAGQMSGIGSQGSTGPSCCFHLHAVASFCMGRGICNKRCAASIQSRCCMARSICSPEWRSLCAVRR